MNKTKIIMFVLLVLIAMPFVFAQNGNNDSNFNKSLNVTRNLTLNARDNLARNIIRNVTQNISDTNITGTLSSKAQQVCDFATNTFSTGLKIPSFIPYGNDVLNIYLMDKEPVGYLETKDDVLITLACGETKESDYNLYIKDYETIQQIQTAKSQLSALNNAISNGALRIEGTNFGTGINTFITRIFITVGSWFA